MNQHKRDIYTKEFRQRAAASRRARAQLYLHSEAKAELRRRRAPRWAIELVCEVAARRGVPLDEVISDNRSRRAVEARFEAIYAIKSRNQALSSPTIGRWFDRDHTSILYAVACHAHRESLPQFGAFQLATARERNRRLFSAGAEVAA